MASTYLTHTTSTPTNSDKATLSFWLKRSKLSSGQGVFAQDTDGNDKFAFILGSNDTISIFQETAGTVDINLVTNRVFRDTSAWYNFVLHFDSTQGAGSNRVQLFVNGVQETSFSTATYPNSNVDFRFNKSGIVQEIGRYEGGNYFDGLLSHINFIDGTIYPASTFGSTDSTTGEWKINTSPSVTYGTNGFFILKDGNSVTDQSGNSNNFTVGGGTLTKTEDSPSNVFATMNSLDNFYAGSTLSNGNNTVATVSSNAAYNPSNFAIKTGKWYWEVKLVACSAGNGSEATIIGMSNQSPTSSGYGGSIQGSGGFGIRGNGKMWAGGSEETGWSAIAVGNIAMIAVDFDNGKFYAGINGTWGNSGDPTSGSTGTGAYSFTVGSDVWFMAVNQRETSQTATFSLNFGEGFFGTTAAGTQADDNGQGLFAYDVPAGYYALNTKNLEAYG